MVDFADLVSREEAVLVFGSLNAKEEDRSLPRNDLQPVQVIFDGVVHPIPYFNSWGELGVSSMALVPGGTPDICVSTGDDLTRLQLNGGATVTRLDVPSLSDVHEMTLIDDTLWLANTGYDEAVGVDLAAGSVVRRIKLAQFRLKASATERAASEKTEAYEEVDRFHCNQVFKAMDGRLYALVHHVTGRQLITRIARKLIKKQGGGGVVDLLTGQGVKLGLKAPHSVRIVNGNYWVFDSGNQAINVYDDSWRLVRRTDTAGWGRGADLSGNLRFVYAGMSAKRKRYLEQNDDGGNNLVQIFDASTGQCVGKWTTGSGIEQINNVYVIPRMLARKLLQLG